MTEHDKQEALTKRDKQESLTKYDSDKIRFAIFVIQIL